MSLLQLQLNRDYGCFQCTVCSMFYLKIWPSTIYSSNRKIVSDTRNSPPIMTTYSRYVYTILYLHADIHFAGAINFSFPHFARSLAGVGTDVGLLWAGAAVCTTFTTLYQLIFSPYLQNTYSNRNITYSYNYYTGRNKYVRIQVYFDIRIMAKNTQRYRTP